MLPFILAGAAIMAGGYGVKKGADAKKDFDTAERIRNRVEGIVERADQALDKVRKEAQAELEGLGALKLKIYKNQVIPFVDQFGKIKNLDFSGDGFQGDLAIPEKEKQEFNELRNAAITTSDLLAGGVGSLGGGGLAGLAAYGGVAWLGTASTGTAIGSLSGVAATNATLAWLGGGSLAAGGFGMAGGMLVMGGIVTGPILAVGGSILASSAAAQKEEAYSNLERAKLYAEEAALAGSTARGIQKRVAEVAGVAAQLSEELDPYLRGLNSLVAVYEKDGKVDYQLLGDSDKENLFKTYSLAVTLKNVIETPILDDSGSLTEASNDQIEDYKQ
ncbi:MAG: hypothetical protein HRT34_05995 [Alcanivorax sp.]|nr:hypothetical protein [Alcanivorax sp.]